MSRISPRIPAAPCTDRDCRRFPTVLRSGI